VKSFRTSQTIANAAYDATQVYEFLELRRPMCMDIVRGDDRRTQAYAQVMACHELGLAYLGSIFCFWQIGVLLRSQFVMSFFVPSIAYADVTFV